MKKKHIIIFIGIFAAAILSSYVILRFHTFKGDDNILDKLQATFISRNKIIVTGKNIDLDKVIIKRCGEEDNVQVVYQDGEQISSIENEYGYDSYDIYYNQQPVATAWIFKTNWWHKHSYYFEIEKLDTTFRFNFSVTGPDSQSAEYRIIYNDRLKPRRLPIDL